MPAAEAARFSRARRRGARARGARVGEGWRVPVPVVVGAAPRRRWDAGGCPAVRRGPGRRPRRQRLRERAATRLFSGHARTGGSAASDQGAILRMATSHLSSLERRAHH